MKEDTLTALSKFSKEVPKEVSSEIDGLNRLTKFFSLLIEIDQRNKKRREVKK